jgi:hypothetical protein
VKSVSELNKQKVRLFVEAVWNQGRLELIDELVAPDFVVHVPGLDGTVLGSEGMRSIVSSWRSAHPGLYIKIEDQIAEDDRVALRWQATATVRDAHLPSPTERAAPCYVGISVIRLLAGKQVDAHTECRKLGPRSRLRGEWVPAPIFGHRPT